MGTLKNRIFKCGSIRFRYPIVFIFNAIVIWPLLILNPATVNAESLTKLWASATRGNNYRKPKGEELRKAEYLFKHTLQQLKGGTLLHKEELNNLRKAWLELNFELIPLNQKGEDFIVLKEANNQQTGRGFYIFRLRQTHPIALQAPHTFSDLYTWDIVLNLFQESQALACAGNTLPRSKADLAHLGGSYFQSLTLAFAETYPKGIVLQLHGFEKRKRKSHSAAEADMILSSGTQYPPALIQQVARCLKGGLHSSEPGTDTSADLQPVLGVVKLYPYDVKDLGATANSQAQALHNLGYDGFIHIEMSSLLRKRMCDDMTVRKALLQCIPIDRI